MNKRLECLVSSTTDEGEIKMPENTAPTGWSSNPTLPKTRTIIGGDESRRAEWTFQRVDNKPV